ncbi:hypothetical protein PDJAM_G00165550, partial [Pangasius djambal]|nr:hypothetical protein [Pangasius djambal]
MSLVLQVGEDDGMAHSHVAVHADARQEERRRVLDAVEEAQHIPGAAGGQVQQVDQLQRWDQAEEGVQHSQVPDEDVRRGRVSPVAVDQPQNHEVGRDPHEHVNKLHAQVEEDDLGFVAAQLVHRLFNHGDISVKDQGVIGVIGVINHLHCSETGSDVYS